MSEYFSIDELKSCFERAILQTPSLAKNTPLGVMKINNEFSHYMDSDTDTLWIGFAMGMRYYSHLSNKKGE
jgi:hypothetical protein